MTCYKKKWFQQQQQIFLGEERKLSCIFLSFCSQKIICRSAKNLICEQGGEGKIGKGEVRVRMCHARQKKADF